MGIENTFSSLVKSKYSYERIQTKLLSMSEGI